MKTIYILNEIDKSGYVSPIGAYTTVNNTINGAIEYARLMDKEPLTSEQKDNLSKNFITEDREEENYIIHEVELNKLFEEF